MDPTPFFDYARERQLVLLRRRAGQSPPWTTDPVIRFNRFCNIFREDDVTTIWLRKNVRERIGPKPELLLATVLFRWFNRMTTGEAIFCQKILNEIGWTAWEKFVDIYDNVDEYNTDVLRESIKTYMPKGPYVTGSYCIIGDPGPKLDGILSVFRNFCETTQPFRDSDDIGHDFGWREVADQCLSRLGETTLFSVWDWLRRFRRSGDFMAYEIVTDLAHSPGFLTNAPDRMTWANAGPGAVRGLNRLHERPLDQQHSKTRTCAEMQELLAESQHPLYWPQPLSRSVDFSNMASLGGHFMSSEWPAWDMRTVEHTLCEFDKYRRIPAGGKVKQVYRGG